MLQTPPLSIIHLAKKLYASLYSRCVLVANAILRFGLSFAM